MPFLSGLFLPTPFLTLSTALGYALATVGMKSVSMGQISLGVLLATIGFLIAFMSEILLMRSYDLSYVYIAIIVAESVLVLLYALCIGEGLSHRQMAGAVLVLLGLWAVAA
ncbi:5-aminolevulinate synthase [Salipiger sp. PrR002]|uniref:5-aminolevulinate synthase n=1 Tax=Salipiger sp. PrR002 TaxID=2706489 RepID=UPI0013B804A3|nr:5-aminolevulinate synthase [Salipiger sp. PrR002]NDW00541.1 5-aminolevulinate synthase [Salipiger sp. PrR002]NDW57630.1 5-aminolevulinate synthase [Salipiger sp. PrR004]